MRFQSQKYSLLSSFTAILISGLSVYYVLSYFLIPVKFVLPISILVSTLSFGLTMYYSKGTSDKIDSAKDNVALTGQPESRIPNRDLINLEKYIPNLIFTLIYFIFLVLTLSFSKPNLDIVYTTWGSLELSNAIRLGIGIILVFFMPGYAIVSLLTKKVKLNSLLTVLFSYLSSMLISGLTIYISSLYSSSNISELRTLLISINLTILLAFIIYCRTYRSIFTIHRNYRYIWNYIIFDVGNKLRKIKANFNEFLVFASIFGLLILYMYCVYGGITIGDQWYHQNRALLIMSGHFKESVLSNGDDIYSPFQSALLAAATLLSDNPLVNTYASIAFLNMAAVFAFYYFILMWLPLNMKRAALIASSLFVIASGFDWTYILYSTATSFINTNVSSIATFFQEQIRSSDIIYAPNFIISAFPDFSTGLIYISLPAGFVLLGLIRFEMKNKFSYIAIICIITILGILSHAEFYIFIIISSILPVIFSLKGKNSVYLALLFALAFVYILDSMFPVDYFTGSKILGIPLGNLAIIFVLVTWGISAIRQNLSKYRNLISFSNIELGKKLNKYTTRTSFMTKVVLVWVFAYLYVFSFVVWTQLPSNYIDVQRDGETTPWYFYPMRLGVVGLIGLACILSYIFKRFEKEVFIFGIIMLIAFLLGPFYDEQRMTKYIMAGTIGLASLLIYRILTFVAIKNKLVYGIIIGIVVLSTSLSTLMFIGYNAVTIQTQDFSNALGRRNFPSMQEMNMLDLMRSKLQGGSNTTNIAALPYEYNPWEGYLITKLHAFSGLPLAMTYPNSLVLNASRVDSFYNLLDYSNTRYIIIPANSINDRVLPDSTRFALENFQRIYNDSNYQVLKVPSLNGPSTLSNTEIGIIYESDEDLLSKMTNRTALRLDNVTFDDNDKNKGAISVKNVSGTEKVTLNSNNNKSGQTLWSKKIDNSGGINYIETRFRILSENKNGDLSGLKWYDNGRYYFLYLSNEGLKLEQQSNNNETLFIFTNTGVEKNNWTSYKIGISSLENSINVYVNNILKIKIPKIADDSRAPDISKIGIYCANNTVEFEPIVISKTPSSEKIYGKVMKYDYYYPLSSLALSGIGYEAFVQDDFSVLAKKAIIMPFDHVNLNESVFKKYIEYARSGGTLIVMNPEDFNGKFSKFLSVETSANKTKFSYLKLDNTSSFIKVSGVVKNIRMKPSSDTFVTASYRDNNNNFVAPLTIERHFPNGGKIILLNNQGYFDAIQDSPTKYFLSLTDFYKFFDLPSNNGSVTNEGTQLKFHFIGDTKLSGMISIKGHAIFAINESNSSGNIDVEELSIINNKGKLKNHFKNVSVVNMNLFGGSEIFINATGNVTLPSQESHYDYVGMSIPNGFNMTISLPADEISQAQIVTKNNALVNPIEIKGGSKVQFYNVTNPTPMLSSLSMLIKSPEITVIGNTSFDKTHYFAQMARVKDTSLDFTGRLKIKFNFMDQYNERYHDGIRTQDITYIDLINGDGKVTGSKSEIKLPGDISTSAKQQGLIIPIFDIFTSSANIATLSSISALAILLSWLRRKRVL